MSKYKIAGLIVEMDPKFELLKTRSKKYLIDTDHEVDIYISLPEGFVEEKHKENPHLSLDECEYLWSGQVFYSVLPKYDGVLLHSSCVAVDGEAYLFSAPCGTGKSTHTQLWQKHFGDRLIFVNDDKPALRIIDGKVYAYGTPFSGKTSLNSDVSVPLKGICMLSRGEKNHIRKIGVMEALPLIMNQTLRPFKKEHMVKVLENLDRILSEVPVYSLSCNMEPDAVITSYNGMNGMIE